MKEKMERNCESRRRIKRVIRGMPFIWSYPFLFVYLESQNVNLWGLCFFLLIVRRTNLIVSTRLSLTYTSLLLSYIEIDIYD